jgi:hypothetical protein
MRWATTLCDVVGRGSPKHPPRWRGSSMKSPNQTGNPWCAIISCPNFVPCARARRRPSLARSLTGNTSALPRPRTPQGPQPWLPSHGPLSVFRTAAVVGGMLAVLHRPPDVWQSPAQSIVQSIDSIDSRLFVEPQTPGCILYVRSGQPRLRVGEQHWWSAPNLTAQRSAPWSNPVSTTCGDHHRPPNVQRCRAHRCKPSCILDLTWPSAYKG